MEQVYMLISELEIVGRSNNLKVLYMKLNKDLCYTIGIIVAIGLGLCAFLKSNSPYIPYQTMIIICICLELQKLYLHIRHLNFQKHRTDIP